MEEKKRSKQDNFYIITGPMGAGKSTIINEAQHNDWQTINEPAREILEEQRLINGDGVSEKNCYLFVNLMLSRAIHNFKLKASYDQILLSDRGIADLIVYAKWFDLDTTIFEEAARKFIYNKTVFITQAWPDIYKNDSERTMSYDEACRFGELCAQTYLKLGYNLVEIPQITPSLRLSFIINYINKMQ